MLLRTLVALILIAAPFRGVAESITFEIFSVENGGRNLLHSGSRTYSNKDFVVSREERSGRFYGVRKALELHNGFSVQLIDTLDQQVTGFGLSVVHLPLGSHPNGFSWEWYTGSGSGEFVKLQGGTKIRLRFHGEPALQEIHSIEFLEDVVLRYEENIRCEQTEGPTHLVVIKGGSVLSFPVGSET
jgi:hypothetical protein